MRRLPLVQQSPIDVSDWEPDADFAIFPQGARAKEALVAPDFGLDQVLVPGKRYLFKRSKKSYPDQFWGEVIAYRIGCLLGVSVPPAFFAVNNTTQVSGALIEWFYTSPELFVHGGDFMQMVRPDYDRDRGTKHNLEDIRVLMQALLKKFGDDFSWRQWWVEALMFDALIGNTDRHQDNWGIIFMPDADKNLRIRMPPLFDNGTSLGHERFADRVSNWTQEQLSKYVLKGRHHVKWKLSIDESPLNGHLALLEHAIANWHGMRELAIAKLTFNDADVVNSLHDLLEMSGPVPLTTARLKFVIRLLSCRLTLLKELLNGTAPAHS